MTFKPCRQCWTVDVCPVHGDTYRLALESLHRVSEFDHPFRVHPDGATVSDDGLDGVYAPEVFNDDTGDVDVHGSWTPLTGYTGQYGYNGAVMHASEYLGGQLARDILAAPGVYAVTAVEVLECDESCDPAGEHCPGGHEPAGWAILRRDDTAVSA